MNLQENLERTCDQFLRSSVDSSLKCVLLRGRLETDGNGRRVQKITPLPIDILLNSNRLVSQNCVGNFGFVCSGKTLTETRFAEFVLEAYSAASLRLVSACFKVQNCF
jgi:hypothetical protein